MAKKQFKAESKKLLDMMINSIYTHKEIFLREIISNASDAIDKLCYQSLTDENVGMARGDFKIRVIPDKEARTITVSDNGIGMTKDELDSNLGVIARSGSPAPTAATPPISGSAPARTATPSPRRRRIPSAPTSSCTSRPTRRVRNTPPTSKTGSS